MRSPASADRPALATQLASSTALLRTRLAPIFAYREKAAVMPKRRDASHALSLSQLRREVRTALELAVAALAPTPLVDELATAAGLLEALAQFPHDAAPVLA